MKNPIRKALAASLAILPLCCAFAASASAADAKDRAWGSRETASAVVHFQPGSSELSLSARQTLHALAVEARTRRGGVAVVAIKGHSDPSGDGAANDFLASERAIAAGAFLDSELDIQRDSVDQIYDAESDSDLAPAKGCARGERRAGSAACRAADRRAVVTISFWPR